MFDAQPTEIDSGERAAGQVPVARSRTKKPVLIVLHQANSNPGHVGQWLVRNGFPLDIRKPRFGEPLPETLASHCGAAIFGGPMSANDKDEFIRDEIEWIGVALPRRRRSSASASARRCWRCTWAPRSASTPRSGPRSGTTRSNDAGGPAARGVSRPRLPVAP